MSTTAATGFCRVTVVAPDRRIDVALPEDLAVADICPEIVRLTGRTQAVAVPAGHHLVRRDGTVLDGARTLADQRVLDGEILSLRPFAESLPPAVFDDVSDAVASALTPATPSTSTRRRTGPWPGNSPNRPVCCSPT
ncbi:EsaB/YukD family protein, partial [Streptomyces sp. NPDC005406]|uniref:EsaB/YukD family protein n=1 Tax=Streptomyces sp. NPDC005406 TaxID=3155339 RepID=UPI003452023E